MTQRKLANESNNNKIIIIIIIIIMKIEMKIIYLLISFS